MEATAGLTCEEAERAIAKASFECWFAVICLRHTVFATVGVFAGIQPAANTRKVTSKVDPRYPELARQYQLKGKVKIELTVSPDGSVKKTRVVGGSPLLAGAALEAARQWKYEPGEKETVETIDFSFEYDSR